MFTVIVFDNKNKKLTYQIPLRYLTQGLYYNSRVSVSLTEAKEIWKSCYDKRN
jgi:hypothetical protein